jgi:hypothetical protein
MITRPKNKDLIEVFGYAPDDQTKPVRSLWSLGACPFINKKCGKGNHDNTVTYGTCSVTSPYGDCIICPNRLYENDYEVLRTISAGVFGKQMPFFTFEDYIKNRGLSGALVVALGQNSGKEVKIGKSLSMDWVLAKIEDGSLVEYVGVEVQSLDITGNYRDCWYGYKNLKNGDAAIIPSSGHGMNWANVHKRLIPQIIRKGKVYSTSKLVKSGLFFVLPEIVYKKFEDIIGKDIPMVKSPAPDILSIHTYELSPAVPHGQQRHIVPVRQVMVSLEEFSQRFISGPNLPSGEQLDSAVKRVLGI